MKRLFACLALAGALLAGCSDEEEVLPDQQKRMESYLRSTHAPRLVHEEEVADEQLPCYSTAGNTVYRYIANRYDPERPARREVGERSSVRITFRAYVFSFANIVTSGQSVTMPYYTNDPLLRDAFLSLEGFNPAGWSFEPLAIEMGSDDILKGLRLALLGCREGDEVEAYMTYNMAYGGDDFSVVPEQSPVAIFFTVDSVE
ncbi:FKBP-type peptidyl-prolyl cis-trans isomerase [uncultured Alistipes sp.]|uniref:FKBP-type peptidyl-prolyl cis-trans isomerase n=1 Tax=uncultured Alistipes sp. TaxID=538949 RepID=UPI00261D10C7|nr:FKBP-type peptidyl-prolyl cis-trans isomerase [uncultured Alistipes sp.]